MLICFSGMDGTGKTTVAHWLSDTLNQQGIRTRYFNMLNGDSVLRRLFGRVTTRVRTHTHRQSSYQLRRVGLLRIWPVFVVIDAYLTYVWLKLMSRRNVVIIDRYFYDEFAIMGCVGLLTSKAAVCLCKLIPKPTTVFQLQSTATTGFERKPEHPLEFYQRQEELYGLLAQSLDVISIDTQVNGVKEVQQKVQSELHIRTGSLL